MRGPLNHLNRLSPSGGDVLGNELRVGRLSSHQAVGGAGRSYLFSPGEKIETEGPPAHHQRPSMPLPPQGNPTPNLSPSGGD